MLMQLVELSFLREVTGNNPTLIKEFLNDFLIEEEEFENTIHEYIINQDVASIKKAIHRFKSCIKVIGMPTLNAHLDLMEYYLKNQDFENVANEICHMKIVVINSKKEFEANI